MSVQLGLGLNRRLGGFNPFNPTHLNPYLLFDTQSSMIGTFENPTLDLDPSNPSSLDIITATRAGVATYTDADGVIQSASPNTVRVDHVDGVPMILIEPSATNLLPYSEDFSVWTELNTTITVNDSLAPDGNQTAAKVTADSGSAVKRISSYAATASVIDYTVSFYAKAGSHQFVQTTISNSGALYANFDLINGQSQAFGGATSNMTLATNGFYRCEFTFTGAASLAAGYISFADSLTHARGDSSSSTGDFYIWGAQTEEGPVATSYIPTSGSTVTRNADNLVIDGAAFSDFFNTAEGTFFVAAQFKDPYSGVRVIRGGTNSQLYLYSNDGTAQFYAFDGTGVAAYGTVSANELSNFAISYTASTFSVSKDGSGPTSQSSVSGNIGNATVLQIGSSNSDKAINGHIRRLIYWPYHSDDL